MRFARPALIAVLVLLLAVTPLSALILPGQFEVRFRSEMPWHPGLTVRLNDRTGLVKGLSLAPQVGHLDGVTNHGPDGRMLIVSWSGSCGAYLTELTLERTDSGYRLRERTHDSGCAFLVLLGWAVAIRLWAPIDAATVEFHALDATP